MGQYIGGALAGLSIIAITITYAMHGAVPDVLSTLASVSVGGFFGTVVPGVKRVEP